MKKPLLFHIGKAPEEPMHAKHLLPLPSETPFGNLSLKFDRIIYRLDHANISIIKTHEYFNHIELDKRAPGIMKHLLLQEEILYWMRQSADELISLASVLESWKHSGKCPEHVPVDCIGAFLKTEDPDRYDRTKKFLTTLNDVSNAYKHSFVNTQIQLIGGGEPTLFALGLTRNTLKNTPVFYEVALSYLIGEFNCFFESIRDELKDFKIPATA